MKLSFEHGKLYIDNVRFCHYEVTQDGSKDLQPGSYPVEARYAHNFWRVLPLVDDFGWLANDISDPVVLGRVRTNSRTLPCKPSLDRVIALIEQCEDDNKAVTLEVK